MLLMNMENYALMLLMNMASCIVENKIIAFAKFVN